MLEITVLDLTPTHSKVATLQLEEIALAPSNISTQVKFLFCILTYFLVMNNHKGEPLVIKNAICIHEEDAGLLWKHVDHHTLKPEVRRNRRLVVSFIASLVNYEYAFYWYFYLDGSIQFEPRLTGILSTTVLPENEQPKYGTLIAPQLNGPWHQRNP